MISEGIEEFSFVISHKEQRFLSNDFIGRDKTKEVRFVSDKELTEFFNFSVILLQMKNINDDFSVWSLYFIF